MSGIRTFVGPSYRANLTPDGLGGVFHSLEEFSIRDPGATDRRTFYDMAGRTLYAVAIYGGMHPWQIGVDGNGYPYLQCQGFPIPSWYTGDPNGYNTKFAVFAL